jgi:gamma-glutamyltranspeptidase/glutathione hydrolase/leukotriene-C4 hydrolase
MNVREASETGRLHHQLYPNEVWVEESFPDYLRAALLERNHKVIIRPLGIVHSIYIDSNSTLWASSDFRCAVSLPLFRLR